MKKTLFFIASIIWTACSSDQVQERDLPDKGRILIVEATKGQTNTRGLNLDDNTLYAVWEKGEKVSVLSDDGKFLGTLEPETTGSSSTTLKSTGPIDVSDKQNLTLIFPGINHDDDNSIRKNDSRDYTGQIGTLENIAKYYDYATASVTVSLDNNGSTASTSEATFKNQQAIVRFTLTDEDGLPISANSLTIAADGLLQKESTLGHITIIHPTDLENSNKESYVTNVFYAALSGVEEDIVTLTATDGNPNYSYTTSDSKTFKDGYFYSVTVKMKKDIINTPLTLECFDKNGCEVHVVGSYNNLLYYQSDNKKWMEYDSDTSISLKEGEWVSFRGTRATEGDGSSEYMNIQCTGNCYVYGNVMSLLKIDNFATMVDLPYDHTFQNLFKGNDCIFHDSGKDLVLPATKLISHCYYQMFYNCVNLSSIKCLATEFPEDEDEKKTVCFQWLEGAGANFANDGCTFFHAKGFDGWKDEENVNIVVIPDYWDVVEE